MYSYAELDWSAIGIASSGILKKCVHNDINVLPKLYCQHTVKATDLANGSALVITALLAGAMLDAKQN